ncbi:MAG: hypothetical protein ACO3HV_12105 [Candidatus Nanopelagicales bacterium]
MAKTYNTFTNVSAGSVLTASDYNDVLENVGNYRVPPMCLLTKSAQSITAGSDTAITGYTEAVDTDGMYDAGSPTRITIATAGLYLFTLNVLWSGTASTRTDAYIKPSGGSATAYRDIRYGTSERNHLTVLLECAAADYFEAFVYYTPGTLTATVRFSAVWQGQVS